MSTNKLTPKISSLKQARELSPLIDRVCQIHDRNLEKEQQAQTANHNIVAQYYKFKKVYEDRLHEKDQQIMKKMAETNKAKIQFYKKQSLHVEKIYDKFKKEDRRREEHKLERINQRSQSLSKRIKSNQSEFTPKKVSSYKSELKKSFNLGEFYRQRYLKDEEMCEQVRRKSLEKQEKAEENRRSIISQNPIKETNEAKKLKKIKAEEEFLVKSHHFLRKSIEKIQRADLRYQEHSESKTKKLKNLREQSLKNLEEIRRRRIDLQQKIQIKLVSIQKKESQKEQRFLRNKQNIMLAKIEQKRNKRQKNRIQYRLNRVDCTLNNFKNYKNQYDERMSELYKRDREDWGFVTSIGAFKNGLIQRNINQNNKLSLIK